MSPARHPIKLGVTIHFQINPSAAKKGSPLRLTIDRSTMVFVVHDDEDLRTLRRMLEDYSSALVARVPEYVAGGKR